MIVIITAMPIMIKIVIVMTIPEENKLISIENHFFLTLKTSQISGGHGHQSSDISLASGRCQKSSAAVFMPYCGMVVLIIYAYVFFNVCKYMSVLLCIHMCVCV